jgi:hypothetical protein
MALWRGAPRLRWGAEQKLRHVHPIRGRARIAIHDAIPMNRSPVRATRVAIVVPDPVANAAPRERSTLTATYSVACGSS